MINELRLYAEDIHSTVGHNKYSKAMSLAADTLELMKATIKTLNSALTTTSEGNAKLLMENLDLKEAIKTYVAELKELQQLREDNGL